MGFRRIKAKKYSGISEYYRDSDIDKKTVAYYIDYIDYLHFPTFKQNLKVNNRNYFCLVCLKESSHQINITSTFSNNSILHK